MGPVNEIEMGYMFISLLLSVLLNVFLIGDLAIGLDTLGEKDMKYQQRYDEMNSSMRAIELDDFT